MILSGYSKTQLKTRVSRIMTILLQTQTRQCKIRLFFLIGYLRVPTYFIILGHYKVIKY